MISILVTGAGGFIGKNLLKRLNQSGYDVDGLDISKSGCTFIEDITDIDWGTIELESYDAVIHLAAKVSVPESFDLPELYHCVNVTSTEKLFQKCVEKNIKNVIFASSAAVYGNSTQEIKIVGEEGIIESPYAKNKLDGEGLAYSFSKFKTKFTCLRFFNVYGPGQTSDSQYSSVIPLFINKIIENNDLIIYGEGNQTRDFIHVSDVCDVIISCINNVKLPNFSCINLGTGMGVSILDLAKILLNYAHELNYDTMSNIVFQDQRPGDVLYSTADILPLTQIYNIKSFISFEDGIRDLLMFSINGASNE